MSKIIGNRHIDIIGINLLVFNIFYGRTKYFIVIKTFL